MDMDCAATDEAAFDETVVFLSHFTDLASLSVILCASHNQCEGAYYAEQSEEGIA